jgi:hypothetical protein
MDAMSPGEIAGSIRKHRSKLNALFADDKDSLVAINKLAKLGSRLSLGPGIAGSDTAPKLWYADALRQAVKVGAASGTTVTGLLREIAEKRVFSADRMAEAISTPGVVGPFAEAVEAIANPGAIKTMSKEAAQNVVTSLGRLLTVMPTMGVVRYLGQSGTRRVAESPQQNTYARSP